MIESALWVLLDSKSTLFEVINDFRLHNKVCIVSALIIWGLEIDPGRLPEILIASRHLVPLVKALFSFLAKNFYPSHRIFKHMHETLNVYKK